MRLWAGPSVTLEKRSLVHKNDAETRGSADPQVHAFVVVWLRTVYISHHGPPGSLLSNCLGCSAAAPFSGEEQPRYLHVFHGPLAL